jgi:hypothetical protein
MEANVYFIVKDWGIDYYISSKYLVFPSICLGLRPNNKNTLWKTFKLTL